MLMLPAPRPPRAVLEAVIPWRYRVPKQQGPRVAPILTTAEKTHFQKIAYNNPRWLWERLRR
jgi:hypothetical protein